MGESYSERDGVGAAQVRALLAQLLPEADVDLLVAGLRAERDAGAAGPPPSAVRHDSELDPAARELSRVRTQLLRGEAARMLQHAINNPLTALLAEAQMLELETLSDEQRRSVERMIHLARRLVTLTKGLDAAVPAAAPRPAGEGPAKAV